MTIPTTQEVISAFEITLTKVDSNVSAYFQHEATDGAAVTGENETTSICAFVAGDEGWWVRGDGIDHAFDTVEELVALLTLI